MHDVVSVLPFCPSRGNFARKKSLAHCLQSAALILVPCEITREDIP